MERQVAMALAVERIGWIVLVVLACAVAFGCRTPRGREAAARFGLRLAGDAAVRGWLGNAPAGDVEDLRARISDDAGGLLAVLNGEDAAGMLRLDLSERLVDGLGAYKPLGLALLDTVLAEVRPIEALGAANVKRARAFLEGVLAGAEGYRR